MLFFFHVNTILALLETAGYTFSNLEVQLEVTMWHSSSQSKQKFSGDYSESFLPDRGAIMFPFQFSPSAASTAEATVAILPPWGKSEGQGPQPPWPWATASLKTALTCLSLCDLGVLLKPFPNWHTDLLTWPEISIRLVSLKYLCIIIFAIFWLSHLLRRPKESL